MAKTSSARRRQPRPVDRSAGPAENVPSRKVDLAAEYHYVLTDLKRIGIIAAVLIGGLVVLSFFLR